MRKLVYAAALTLMAAAPPIGLSATPALAATATWTVTPGGSFSGSAGQTVLWDLTTNFQMGGAGGHLAGSLKSGTGLNGSGIGTVTSIALSSSSPSMSVKWPLNARSYNPTSVGGTTTFRITKVHFAVASGGCSFVVDGTSGTAGNGTTRFKYSNGTHRLRGDPSGGTLHFYDVTGCPGLKIHNGDALYIAVYYTITPNQTITSP